MRALGKTLVFVVLACIAFGADAPLTPRSPAVQTADDAYRTAKQKAAEAYAASLTAAQDEYVKKLDSTLKDVMQKGDLDEANRINAWKKWVLDQGAQPSDPVIVLPSNNGVVYLSDMEAFDVVVINGNFFGKKGVFRGNDKIVVNGKYSPNGICSHPYGHGMASVRFELNQGFDQFRSQVAINDTSSGAASPITFSVLGDGKELWKSLPIQRPHRTQNCNVSVKGVRNLVLQVNCPGEHQAAYAVWLEPQLTRETKAVPIQSATHAPLGSSGAGTTHQRSIFEEPIPAHSNP